MFVRSVCIKSLMPLNAFTSKNNTAIIKAIITNFILKVGYFLAFLNASV